MKIGGNFYRNDQLVGQITFVSAFANVNSRDPAGVNADKTTQYRIIVNAKVPSDKTDAQIWTVGREKRAIRIIDLRQEDAITLLTIDLIR